MLEPHEDHPAEVALADALAEWDRVHRHDPEFMERFQTPESPEDDPIAFCSAVREGERLVEQTIAGLKRLGYVILPQDRVCECERVRTVTLTEADLVALREGRASIERDGVAVFYD